VTISNNGTSTTLRPAQIGDAEAIAVLSTQLGYPSTTQQAQARLSRLLSMPDHCVLLAEEGGRTVGWAHVEQRLNLESGDRAELMGLVVDERARRSGVGSKLVEAAEHWAAARGLEIMVVRSNVARDASHAFYRMRGYHAVKTQHVYQKSMKGNAHRT
jgi:GNAT superfamily N-acetyltransferase